MTAWNIDLRTLNEACVRAEVQPDLSDLMGALRPLFPGLELNLILTRGGWHRLGGVVTPELRRVAHHLAQWAEQESGGDMDELRERHGESGYLATRLAGKTHYFAAVCGEGPEDFIQVEVEELMEETDRPLFWTGWEPEDMEEFLDPSDCPRPPAQAVGRPYYLFRRAFGGADMLRRLEKGGTKLRRFVAEWKACSAGRQPLCSHWLFAVRESLDRFGQPSVSAKPIAVREAVLPPTGQEELSGLPLANWIGEFDKGLGYPFAWYFDMLAASTIPHELAWRVHADHEGEFGYLPERDLEILRQWTAAPYRL